MTPAEVLAAAFPGHPRVGEPMRPVDCPQDCEHRTWSEPVIATEYVLGRAA